MNNNNNKILLKTIIAANYNIYSGKRSIELDTFRGTYKHIILIVVLIYILLNGSLQITLVRE